MSALLRQVARAGVLRSAVADFQVEIAGCSRRSLHVTATAQTAAPAAAPSDTIEVKVNGRPVDIPKGSTVMAACDAAGIDIPRYHLFFSRF